MSSDYTPPFSVTAKAVQLVSEISELIGQLAAGTSLDQMPYLRRSNRLRTIQASLAIESNTLSLEQVTSIIAGKKVLGPPKEIKEVKNAFGVYEQLENLDPFKQKDLLRAHKILMTQLVDKSGAYRTGPIGIAKGDKVIHIAPPAENVPFLLGDLFSWLKTTDVHPLIASSVFHYEFEFIHPFADGNGMSPLI